ncbi:MAG: HDOD domain-containing protein [Calditrichaeota bacterium]|nr:HDOD domain-containing protein [Calditrichota bacterium]RQV98780.1 MAG: HDOD domain-containing protein [Calditrichota bacterium]
MRELLYLKMADRTFMLASPDEIFRKLHRLPVYPGLASEIVKICGAHEADIPSLIKLIASDQGLTLEILKVANSRFYNYEKQISSIEGAIVILGMDMVKQMAVSLSLSSLSRNILLNFTEMSSKLARHALNTALILKMLGENFDSANHELLYYSGLLHDSGKLIFLQVLGEEYAIIYQKSVQENRSLCELESEYFGMNHTEVGAVLTQRWHLPEELTHLIRYHHQPMDYKSGEKVDFRIRLVYLGNLISHFIENGLMHYDELKKLDSRYQDILSITEIEFGRLVEQARKEIQAHFEITKLLEMAHS